MATENVNDGKVLDAIDTVDTKLKQLQSLLMMTYGEAQDSFESMNEDLRGNFMWACHDMVTDCIGLLEIVWSAKSKAVEVSHG